MIQGGDPLGTGTGGGRIRSWYKTKDEFSDKLTHLRGAVSMAMQDQIPAAANSLSCNEEME